MGNNFKKVDLTANGLLNSSNLGAIRETAESNISTNSTTNSTTKALYTFQSDTIGNITKVGDVVDLNWNGRRLESIIQSGTEVLSYEYNVDGQRVSKTFIDPETNTTYTTEYFYNGSILAGQKRGNDVLVFMYDNNGDVFGFEYNGTPYYYVKNAQNDVFLILDENGMIQVLYQYDSWGKVTFCADATDFGLAGINPIMYRSYYVDLEMGFFMYYLNSRYYMADWGRFLSADSYVQTGQGMLDKNMFAYCLNNPVNNYDKTGDISLPIIAIVIIVTGTIVGAVLGALSKTDLYETGQQNQIKQEENNPPINNTPKLDLPQNPNEDSKNDNTNTSQTPKLSTKQRVRNTFIGAAGGLIASAGLVAVAGAAFTLAAGVTVGAPVAAIGILAYNVFPILLAPIMGIEAEPIEWCEC